MIFSSGVITSKSESQVKRCLLAALAVIIICGSFYPDRALWAEDPPAEPASDAKHEAGDTPDTLAPPPVLDGETPDSLAPPAPPGEEGAAPTPPTEEGDLPRIEAREFPVTGLKMSQSQRVYLFDYGQDAEPKPGRLLLLSEAGRPIMAFRVIKTYKEKRQFAAKRIRRYRGIETIELNKPFDALEKLSDIVPPPSMQDQKDLMELEGRKETDTLYDPRVDQLDLPAGAQGVDVTSLDDVDENVDFGLSVQELFQLDHYVQGFGLEAGYYRNTSAGGALTFYRGLGFRYSLTPIHMMFLRRPRLQDSLGIEIGSAVYKKLGYVSGRNDSYTVMPSEAVLRYSFLIGENLSIFLYGGILK
ncbi:MAG: hypothetical protein AAB425_01545, partial [Bdellovibrionota bacterium]